MFSIYLFILFIYFWLHWVFVAVRRLSLVASSGGYSSLQCAGFSLQWLLLLRSTGSRHMGFSSCGSRARERRLSSCGARASHCSGFSCCGAQALGTRASVVVAWGLESTGSVVVVHGLSCSTACGIFLDQGSNLCPLHWQSDS